MGPRRRIEASPELGDSFQVLYCGNRTVGGDGLGHPVEQRRGKTKDLPYLAYRVSRPKGHIGADHGCVLFAVLLVDVLDYLLPPRGVDVDVYIGDRRGFVEEPADKKGVPDRIDRGDAEEIGDKRACRGTPALRQDPLPPGELHNVPDNEKIAAEPFLFNECKLLFKPSLYLVRWIAVFSRRPLFTKAPEISSRADACRKVEVRKTVRRKIELELAGFGNGKRAADRLGRKSGKKQHLPAILQVILRIGMPERRGIVEARPAPDADEDVVQLMTAPLQVMDVIDRDQRNAGLFPELREPPAKPPVLRIEMVLHFEIEAAGRKDGPIAQGDLFRFLLFPLEKQARDLALLAARKADEPVAERCDMSKSEMGVPLRAGKLGPRDETGKIGVALSIFDEQGEVTAVLQRQLRPHDGLYAGCFCRPAKLRNAVKSIVVGKGNGDHAPGAGAFRKVSGKARSIEERQVGMGMKLNVFHRRLTPSFADAICLFPKTGSASPRFPAQERNRGG